MYDLKQRKVKGNIQTVYKLLPQHHTEQHTKTTKHGIELTESDIDLLHFLSMYPSIKYSDVHRFLETVHGYKGYRTINRRLSRLMDEQLIYNGTVYERRHGEDKLRFKYSQLRKRGARLLAQLDRITSDDVPRSIYYSRNAYFKEHKEGIIQTHIRLREWFKKRNVVHEHINPYSESSFKNEVDELVLVPDLVFRTLEQVVDIEVDTGSESYQEFKLKLDRYRELDQLLDKKSEQHLVLFVVTDGALKHNYSEQDKRPLRVDTIKKYIGEYGEFSNLTFKCVSLIDLLTRPIYQFIFENDSIQHAQLEKLSEDMEEDVFERMNGLGYQVYIDSLPKQSNYQFAKLFRFNHPKTYAEHHALYVPMLEGDVYSFDRVRNCLEEHEAGDLKVEHVVAYYPTEEMAIFDVLPFKQKRSRYLNLSISYHDSTIYTDDVSFPMYELQGIYNQREEVDYIEFLNQRR